MASFETFKCPDCRAGFAVENSVLTDDVEEVSCPLCQSAVELEFEDGGLDSDSDDDEEEEVDSD